MSVRISCCLCAILLAIAAVPALADPAQPKVLIIGVDGVRADALLAADTPNIDQLASRGSISYEAQANRVTSSGPGWSSMLTGTWSDKQGVTGNSFSGSNFDRYPHFFSRIKEVRPDLKTTSIVHWSPINDRILSGADNQAAGLSDADATIAVTERLADSDDDVIFLHLDDVDHAGHSDGFSPDVPAYLDAIETADAQIGAIYRTLQRREGFNNGSEDWLILISSDHGGLGTSHGGNTPEQRTVFYLASGPSAKQGGTLYRAASIVDVAATAIAHLGIDAKDEWQLDGAPVGLKDPASFGTNLIVNPDAEASTGYAGFLSDGVNGGRAGLDVGVYGYVDITSTTVVNPDNNLGLPLNSRAFVGGAGGDSSIYQVIDLQDLAETILASRAGYHLQGLVSSIHGDESSVRLEWLDEQGQVIGSPLVLSSQGQEQALKTLEGVVPAEALRARVTLVFDDSYDGDPRGNAEGNFAYIDDLSLVITPLPEPATLMLLGMGVLGLTTRHRCSI